MTSAFPRTSIPDVLTHAASSSPRSRPPTADINETLSAPAPKANVEPAVAPSALALPDIAEPILAPISDPKLCQLLRNQRLNLTFSPYLRLEDGPQRVRSQSSRHVLLAFSFKYKVRISGFVGALQVRLWTSLKLFQQDDITHTRSDYVKLVNFCPADSWLIILQQPELIDAAAAPLSLWNAWKWNAG